MTMRWPSIAILVALSSREATSLVFTGAASQRHDNRRAFLSKNVNNFLFVAASTTIIAANPIVASAEEEAAAVESNESSRGGRPFAPLQALLPATRLKLWVGGVHVLSQDVETIKDPDERFKIAQAMNERLSNPPKLFQGEKIDKRTSSSVAQLTTSVSSANKDQYQQNRKGFNVGDKMTAMMNQADVERQWGMLQYAESKREEGNDMRAAFNFYTRQVTFADEYVLTASKEEKKKMIRNDELPTLSAVITSDLDRRDLYRNQFLTAIDDATAEAAYQVKQSVKEVDVLDLVDLVNQAYVACDNWFALIALQDVEEATKEVQLNK